MGHQMTEEMKTQSQLFRELNAAKEISRLATLAVEAKLLEMAEELGATFKHEGLCEQYPKAAFLQIRVRMNKKLGRKAPFFVPLPSDPKAWLGKAARDEKARTPEETELLTGIPALDKIMEGGLPIGIVVGEVGRAKSMVEETVVAGSADPVVATTVVEVPEEQSTLTVPEDNILD